MIGEDISFYTHQLRRITTGLVGYESVELASKLAVILHQHVLIIGRRGTGKSMFATLFFQHFQGRTFRIQLSKFMTEEFLFGIPDLRRLREEGAIVYNQKDYSILSAHWVFLDELFDANDSLLRSLLSVLNERIFMRGQTFLRVPLITAIATSNYQRITEVTEAVVDRFLFQVRVRETKEFSHEELVEILEFTPKITIEEKIPIEVIRQFPKMLENISVPKIVKRAIVSVAKKLDWSPRRMQWALQATKAYALLRNKPTVDSKDLSIVLKLLESDKENQSVLEDVLLKSIKETEYLEMIEEIQNALDNLENPSYADSLEELKEITGKLLKFREKVEDIPEVTEKIAKSKRDLLESINHYLEKAKNRFFYLSLP